MSSRAPRRSSGGQSYQPRPRSSSYAAVDNGFNNAPAKKSGRKRWPWVLLALFVVVAAAVAVPVGVVYGTKHTNDNVAASSATAAGEGGTSSSSSAASASRTSASPSTTPSISQALNTSASTGGSSSLSGSSSGSRSSTATSSSATPTASVAAKTKWDWTPGTNTVVGAAAGNWLVLERWMDEDWFTATSSADSWDEWTFTQTVGANAASVLQDHWNSWLTDDDLDNLKKGGVNTLRIPTGFWMWIPTLPSEPYVTTGQRAQLDRVLQGLYDRDMYAVIDMHGLPGSQNGEQESGHNTTTPTFYQALNQARSDATIKAVVDYIAASPYWSIISAIEVCNEPRPYTSEQYGMLWAYYERSYETIQTLGDKAPAMMFSDGFATDAVAFWTPFAETHVTSPPSLLYTDHPYPGYFPAQTNQANILQQTCNDATGFSQMPVPTIITEWSIATGILGNTAWEKQYYTQQLTAWSWYGGSIFWSFRVLNSSTNVLGTPSNYQWSFLDLLARGSIAAPSNANVSTSDFIDSLGSPCGTAPSIVASTNQPTGAGAGTALASATAANVLTASIDSAALAAATSFGYAGLGVSATPTGGSAAALQATASAGGSRMRVKARRLAH